MKKALADLGCKEVEGDEGGWPPLGRRMKRDPVVEAGEMVAITRLR